MLRIVMLNLPSGFVRRSDSLMAASILALSFLIFSVSGVHQVADSSFSMLLSESLIHHHTFALDNVALPPEEPVWWGDYFKYGNLYQLEVVNGHVYYYFPPGSSVLSIPFVAVMNAAGVSAVNADGTYNPGGEVRIEAAIAALLMAALAVIFFAMARLVLPLWWSVIVAFGAALGTQIWSTASRSLWSDTWGSFLLGLVLLMLLGAETNRLRLKPILLATLLSWMYIVRPTFAVHIIAITVYIFLFYRSVIFPYAIAGAVWFAVFAVYSWHLFGHLLPSYFRAGRLQFEVFWTAFAGNLISPGRGLMVYVPVLFFIGYLLVRYRRWIAYPRLVVLAIAVTVAHLVIISGFIHWWGGHSFGARFSTGLVPWFALLAILSLQAMLKAHTNRAQTRKLELSTGAGLLLLSMVINGLGATSHATWLWNSRPVNIDERPERNWDWRQPQFLAGLVHAPLPEIVPLATFDRLDLTTPHSSDYLWYGWAPTGTEFRWVYAREAGLVFRVNVIQDLVFTAKLHASVIPIQHPEQKLSIAFNHKPIAAFSFNDNLPHEISVVLPSGIMRQDNLLELFLPGATSASSPGTGKDDHPRGIAFYWIQFSPKAASYLPRSYKDELSWVARVH